MGQIKCLRSGVALDSLLSPSTSAFPAHQPPSQPQLCLTKYRHHPWESDFSPFSQGQAPPGGCLHISDAKLSSPASQICKVLRNDRMVDVYYVFIPLTKVITAPISTSTNTSTPNYNWFLFCHLFPSLNSQRGLWDLAALLSLPPSSRQCGVCSLFFHKPSMACSLPFLSLTRDSSFQTYVFLAVISAF